MYSHRRRKLSLVGRGWVGVGGKSVSISVCTESIKYQKENAPILLIGPQP